MPAKLLFVLNIVFLLFTGTHVKAQQPEIILPVGHTEDIYSTSYTKDGRFIITAAYDNTAKLWDAYSGNLLHTFSGLFHTSGHIINRGNTTFLSPDGKYLVALTIDGFLKKWELQTTKQIYSIVVGSYDKTSIEYSANGLYLLLKRDSYNSLNTEIIDATSGKLLYRLKGGGNINNLIEFSPDGRFILLQKDSSLYLHNAANGKIVKTLDLPENFNTAFFSPGGKYIAILSRSFNQVNLWRVSDGSLHKVSVSGTFEFSSDGKYMLSTNRKRLNLIDTESGDVLHQFEEMISNKMFGHFSEDGKHIYLTRNRQFIRSDEPYDSVTLIWETATKRLIHTLQGNGFDMHAVIFSPDNNYIATVSGNAEVWDTRTGKMINSFEGQQVAFSPDSKTITITGKRDAAIFSLGLKDKLAELKGYSNNLTGASFTPDGKQLLTLSNERNAKLWDVGTGKIINTFKDSSEISDAGISNDGKYMLITTAERLAKLINLATGKEQYVLGQSGINHASLSPNGQQIITTSDDQLISIWAAGNGKLIKKIKEEYNVSDAAISADGNFAYYVFGQSAVAVLEFTANRIFKIYLGEENIARCRFSADEKRIFILGEKGTARLYETSTGKMIWQFSEASKTEYAVSHLGGYNYTNLWHSRYRHFSTDGKYLVFRTYFDKYIVVRNMDDLGVADTIYLKSGLINDIGFLPGSALLVTGSLDDTIRIWQKKKNGFEVIKKFLGNGFEYSDDGKKLLIINKVQLIFYDMTKDRIMYKALAINESDFFTQLPDKPFYAATKEAVKNLGFRVGKEYFSFDQFDLQLNRPDIVLAAIGFPDTSLIDAYKKAYYKRVKRSGLKPREFSDYINIPVLQVNGQEPYGEINDPVLTFQFTATDQHYLLNRYDIAVNDVPLYGINGYSLKSLHTKRIVQKISIPLSEGKNSIKIIAVNEHGDESFKKTLLITHPAGKKLKTPKLYFIGIGIDQFANSNYNLRYSAKDIRDLSKKLKEKYGNEIIIDTLFNENVTIKNVKALKKKLQQTTVNDKVIISYSGHGMLSKDFDYYLSTYAVNFDKPEENGLPYDELESLLDSIPARKKLLLIDACHSGEVDKEDLVAINSLDTLKIKRGLKPVAYKNEGHLGLKNSFELMQNLFVNVGKSTGATIISAAAGTQFALEGVDNLPNGVFTYSILEAMNKYPAMKISELKKIVGDRVVELTKGLQKPTSRNETIAVDWQVWSEK